MFDTASYQQMTFCDVKNYIFDSGILREIPLQSMIDVLQLSTEGKIYYVFPHMNWRDKAQVLWGIYCAWRSPRDYAIDNTQFLAAFILSLPIELVKQLNEVHK